MAHGDTSHAKSNGQKRIGMGLYLLAGASFIPLIGVPFGLASIVIGFLRRSFGGIRLVVMGAAGIALTILLYGSLFLALWTGQFDGVTGQLAQRLLDDSVRSIEFYRLQHGAYPDSLEVVRSENEFINDPFAEDGSPFRYALREDGKSYEVFSIGPDRIPATSDDLHPSESTIQGTGHVPR